MDLLSLADALEKPAYTFVTVAVHVIALTGPQTYKTKTDTERRYFCATVADTNGSCLLRIYKTIPYMTPGALVFLKDAVRKTGENQRWVVSSTKVSSWAPIDIPQAIMDCALNNKGTKKDGPTKLANAIKSTTACNIVAKVVQTSPLKFRRNGELPIKFLVLQDCADDMPVKMALFGEDAQCDYIEGDVLSVTETYRWKDTHTLSTKKSSKVEYLPQDSIDLPQTGHHFADEDFAPDSTNSSGSEPEEFKIMGIMSAHRYQCCPKSECHNKKLENSQVVLKRSSGTYETRKFFKPDLELITKLPDLHTMGNDPDLYYYLTEALPINARGIFQNGKLTINSAKRSLDL